MSIIVGVDPAHRSASALHLAAMLARSSGTDLVVAAVVPPAWPATAGGADREWRGYTRDNADSALDHAAAVLGDSIAAEYLLHEAASARRGLVELTDQHDGSLIVVGSGAGGQPGRIALGAESDTLLHASPVPVAIAPRGYRTDEDARVTRVTAAYRGTGASTGLVLGAAEVAATLGAELRVASFAVVPPDSGTSGAGLDAELTIANTWAGDIERHAAAVVRQVAELEDAPAVSGVAVGMGETWEAAIADIGWDQGEVLVVGSSTLGPIARVFLGSHATKIVRHSPVPVVVVPHGVGSRERD
ncbi:universal stress protein [Leifsonia sp. F6_8S_P_1B]|uniref:Universal stress protein n=1 Tax=Leifsonia williamsii TaxID=3035919 RepID=A0ABT8K8C0_9MICO|nr:universal stress protein [Leifsonia williamsii]MDN4613689.1 universal stress protein [Leifsonia williamsii]